MGYSRRTSRPGAAAARWLIILWLMQYWSKQLSVVDICSGWSRRWHSIWLSDLLQSELKMKLLEVEGERPIAGDATVSRPAHKFCQWSLRWVPTFCDSLWKFRFRFRFYCRPTCIVTRLKSRNWTVNNNTTTEYKTKMQCSAVCLAELTVTAVSKAGRPYTTVSLFSSISLYWRWGFDKPSPSTSISSQNCYCC